MTLRAQALSKARRTQDARRYALCAETTRVTSGADDDVAGSWGLGSRSRVERRVLADDESVFAVHATWRNNAGKFVLVERKKAADVSQTYVCLRLCLSARLSVCLFVNCQRYHHEIFRVSSYGENGCLYRSARVVRKRL